MLVTTALLGAEEIVMGLETQEPASGIVTSVLLLPLFDAADKIQEFAGRVTDIKISKKPVMGECRLPKVLYFTHLWIF